MYYRTQIIVLQNTDELTENTRINKYVSWQYTWITGWFLVCTCELSCLNLSDRGQVSLLSCSRLFTQTLIRSTIVQRVSHTMFCSVYEMFILLSLKKKKLRSRTAIQLLYVIYQNSKPKGLFIIYRQHSRSFVYIIKQLLSLVNTNYV